MNGRHRRPHERTGIEFRAKRSKPVPDLNAHLPKTGFSKPANEPR
jgi:hypothetical protein